MARGTLERLTTDPAYDGRPLWSPDGQRVAFTSDRSGQAEMLWQAADGSGSADTLVTLPASAATQITANDWSPDGMMLVVAVAPEGADQDIGVVSVGDPDSWRYLIQTPANESTSTISTDGRWLAYASTETGRFEVYVQRFPEGGRSPAGVRRWGPYPPMVSGRANVDVLACRSRRRPARRYASLRYRWGQ